MTPSVWDVLGIAPTHDERAIRRAYGARLKVTNPEDKPEDFKILRAAYEMAMNMAAEQMAAPEPVESAAAALPPMTPMMPMAPITPITQVTPVKPVTKANADYQALCATLETLTAASAENRQMTAALNAIFASPSFERIDVRAHTEIWLLRLIAFNAPRSDALLPHAIAKFGWSEGAGTHEIAELTRMVFRRVRDVKAREKMAQSWGGYHRAFITLSKPFERPGFPERLKIRGIHWEVRQCLNFITREHPSLMQDLNQQTVAAWQAELARLRFSAEGWLALLASPPGILLYILGTSNVQTENMDYMALLLLPLPVFAGAVVYMLAWQMPRRIWRERWQDASPSWVAWGWAPALLLILLLAALIPDSLAGFACIAGLGLLAGAWVIVTAEPDPRLNRPKSGVALALLHAPVIMLCGFAVQLMPAQKFGALFVPGCIAALAFGAGNGVLTRLWFTVSSIVKQRLMIGVSAGVLAAFALTWSSTSDQALAPLAISVTLCVALMTIVPAWELPPRVINLRYRMRLPVVTITCFAATSGVIVAPYLSILLLTWAAWTCGFQLTRALGPKKLPVRRKTRVSSENG